MNRRALSLVVCGLLLVALLAVAWLRPVPYVAQSPGLVQNTLARVDGKAIIEVNGHKTYPTKGQLDFTTVSVTRPDARLTLGDAVLAWVDPDRALVPRDLYYPPQLTPEEAEQQSTVQMASSQDTAAAAALSELGYDVKLPVVVHKVLDGAPSSGVLKRGDEITAVEGTRVRELEDVSRLLQKVDPGGRATLTVRRSGKVREVTTPTEESSDEPGRTVVGVRIGVDPKLPFDIAFHVDEDVGGPSAGLMFSMAIVDKLTPGALTGGLHVAGTGEIGFKGAVGPIGGIRQKIAGAEDAGATVFLVPAPNCDAALRADADDVRLVRVEDLHGAVEAVETLAEDPEASVPGCSG